MVRGMGKREKEEVEVEVEGAEKGREWAKGGPGHLSNLSYCEFSINK